LLLALVFSVSRLGLRLPMITLFKVSTVVLVATAVVLVGQGAHAFEEVGLLPLRPLPLVPRIPFLGIYPDCIGVLAQLAIGLTPLLWKAAAGQLRSQVRAAPRFDEAEPKPGE
jgi:high-affinity iron transporter